MKLLLSAFLMLASPNIWAHGISAADKQAMLEGGYLKYMWLGTTHMLTGYDHFDLTPKNWTIQNLTLC